MYLSIYSLSSKAVMCDRRAQEAPRLFPFSPGCKHSADRDSARLSIPGSSFPLGTSQGSPGPSTRFHPTPELRGYAQSFFLADLRDLCQPPHSCRRTSESLGNECEAGEAAGMRSQRVKLRPAPVSVGARCSVRV